MLATFCSPSRYTQGRDATAALGQEMKTLGLAGPAVIIASASPRARCNETWRTALAEVGIAFAVQPFGGECSLAEIGRLVAWARQEGAHVVIGAGGGKVLDTARAAAAELGVPVVCCPTVASSDAPCSALSVIYKDDGIVQEYRIHGKNPELVLVDTTVIAQAPPRYLAAGMGDALATQFEARTCVAGHVRNMRGGASTRAALALAELCYGTLLEDGQAALQAASEHVVTPALERVVEANTLLSGLGFESSGLAAAHSVHNGLTVNPATRAFFHGEKVGFGALVQLVLEGQPDRLLHEVLEFCTAIGLPTTLAALGLADLDGEELTRIATRATAAGETIHNETFPVTPSMVADAIRAADALGRARRRAAMR
jgi:glycerol dehydrogenase